ncbi:MAG: magnesium protoporphyrin IX methyltransferase [Burkholderiaceae bacterium]|nr:magnesium protoporphyrin IX methyltransferase [Burkholderiaceae bacterium]
MNDLAHATYLKQRDRIEHYFDRTAAQTWARLTSTAPVSGVRATVRAGRDRMRSTLLSYLPADLSGLRLLDAGCGTGALSVEAAKRGADVVAIDLSPTLVNLARERTPADIGKGNIEFLSGDMFDPALGEFDVVVGMDSLIHYRPADVVRVLSGFAARTRHSILFSFPPKNMALAAMITVGKLFPRKDRAPFIQPVSYVRLRGLIESAPGLSAFSVGRTQKISSGFYTSQALELVRRP